MQACTLRRYARVAVLVSLCIGIQLPYSRAQVSSSGVNGVVSDNSGAAVPSAKVTITSTGTNFSRTDVTGSSGSFSIPDLNAGAYDITVEAPGFKRAVLANVQLYVGQMATQNIMLEVGELTQQVTVSAQPPLLNETTGTVGTVVVSELVTELPLNGRNFLQLNLLSPGAIHDKNGTHGDRYDFNPSEISFSVNGQKGDNNLFLLDGTMFKDYVFGTTPFAPSVDAVQEFQIATSNYSAAFGSEAAAQVNLVTKSGTNQLHATAWEYLRNDKLDARNFFQQGATPPFRRNQFGANVGGPVVLPKIYDGRNRSFFFFNYEGFRQVKGVGTLGNYPTPAQLSGDLSSLVAPGTTLVDPFTGQPFPGNVIPQNRMPSTLLPFLQNGIGNGPWIPVPNSTVPGSNYFRTIPTTYFDNQYVVRGDQRINDKTFVFGHVVIDRSTASNPGTFPGESLNPSLSFDHEKPAKSITVHLTSTITPNLLFDFGFGWSGVTQTTSQSTAGKFNIAGQILKIQGLSTGVPDTWGAPDWVVPGFSPLGGTIGAAITLPTSITQFSPGMTLIKGKHSLKWGMLFARHHYNDAEVYAGNGLWVYSGAFTNSPLGDFLLGLPTFALILKNPLNPIARNSELSPYFQDDWKVTPRLTLNLGFRYEWVDFPQSSTHTFANTYYGPNRACPAPTLSCPVPQFVVSNDAQPVTFQGVTYPFLPGVPFVKAGDVGLPNSLVSVDNHPYAPRFGLAYRLPGTSNTVLRGGYGIFYQRDLLAVTNSLAVNAPFVGAYFLSFDQSNFRNFNWFDPIGSSPASGLGFQSIDPHWRPGQVQQWNLTLERSMWNTLFSAAYVGNEGHHLPTQWFPNQAAPGPGPFAPRKPWPTVGSVAGENYEGNSDYHSLQLRVQRDFSKGFALIVGYTFSKAMDDAVYGEGPDANSQSRNWANPAAERSLSAQDIRHRLVVSYVYELPFGKGKTFLNRGGPVDVLLGGWQVTGIASFSSGSPFTVFQTFNSANSDAGANRPNLIGNPNDLSHSRPRGQQIAQFFDTSAFQEANLTNDGGTYRFGNAGRFNVIGPGTKIVDFGAYKNFTLTEALKLQFRAEAFNLFNRPDFGMPGATLGTPQFGTITSTSDDAREIQLALRLWF